MDSRIIHVEYDVTLEGPDGDGLFRARDVDDQWRAWDGWYRLRQRNLGSALGASVEAIVAWLDANPPLPVEPTTFGYVGYVTEADGTVWDVIRYDNPVGHYDLTCREDGSCHAVRRWADVCNDYGTVTLTRAEK